MTGQAIAMSATADRPTDDAAARLGTLFDAHHQRLYRLARRLSRSAEDASDLVQETFLRAARHAASVPEGAGHEEAWLVRVLINLARDRWRQLAVRKRGRRRRGVQHDAGRRRYAKRRCWRGRSSGRRSIGCRPAGARSSCFTRSKASASPRSRGCSALATVTVRWHLSIGRRELAAAVDGRRKEPTGERHD